MTHLHYTHARFNFSAATLANVIPQLKEAKTLTLMTRLWILCLDTVRFSRDDSGASVRIDTEVALR